MFGTGKMKNKHPRLKAPSFVPSVAEITPEDLGRVVGLEAVILHWTDGRGSIEESVREMREDFGSAGLYVRRGDDVLGFLVYGPKGHFPKAEEYPLGPLDEDAILLAYVEGDTRTCRRLLVRMLRDLRQRGVGKVEAIASDTGASRHVPTRLLMESGWRPVRNALFRGKPYTLARTDLGNAVEVGELAKGLIGRVKLPKLGARSPSPGVIAADFKNPNEVLRESVGKGSEAGVFSTSAS
jgi:hypothetical protein